MFHRETIPRVPEILDFAAFSAAKRTHFTCKMRAFGCHFRGKIVD
jgi:hypothetical protein